MTTAFQLTLGKPDHIKQSLHNSQVYEAALDGVLKEAKQESANKAEAPLNEPVLEDATRRAFSPAFLEHSANQILDGTYHWLEGTSPRPDFALDLATPKQTLANGVGDAAVARLQGLPVCTLQQLRQLDPNATDPFALPCRPPGLDLAAERQKIVSQIVTSPDFLKDPTLTADDIKNPAGQNPFDKATHVPRVFQWSQKLPWLLAGLGVLSGVILVLLHDNKRQSLRNIARIFLTTGVLLFVSVGIAVFIMNRLSVSVDSELTQTPDIRHALTALAHSLLSSFNRTVALFATAYVLLGVGGWTSLHFMHVRQKASSTPELSAGSGTTSPTLHE